MRNAHPGRWLILCFLATRLFGQVGDERAGKVIQQEKLTPLAIMDGAWRGTAWIVLPSGERVEMTQTERVGPLLGGAVKVVEGRGYDGSGQTVFNALGVIAYDLRQQKLLMRSYAEGRVGDFPLHVTEDGFRWEIPAGPANIRYTAQIKDDKWVEYGERVVGEQEPMRFFEMTLERLSDCDWPAAGPVPHH